ncbi:hypothetical protein TNIN_681 [Trichonephila inaurata madagascariensis]|uniref:Uncharacterized protein n=1 Tax=Trichonephila inaurata madagascariensis TaxID=2747483 RepID=A0A8X7C8T7_9ARAC|nr:hypothetical protein TNIN_681 [Trichonephila inaurata madagascariensis]
MADFGEAGIGDFVLREYMYGRIYEKFDDTVKRRGNPIRTTIKLQMFYRQYSLFPFKKDTPTVFYGFLPETRPTFPLSDASGYVSVPFQRLQWKCDLMILRFAE